MPRAPHGLPPPPGDRPASATTAGRRRSGPPGAVTSVTLPGESDVAALRGTVLGWYEAAGRSLPFRGATDPWAILVSEAMAQQTQAARAGEAWVTFVGTYPTPAALAAATPADVLRAWRGLGYNRRALALRDAAATIVAEHGGQVPDDLEALERLPGVGPYTARAVLALAFGRPVAAVDTNVRRVVGRLVGAPAVSPGELQRLADALVDPGRPGDWTHALMDVGASICRGPRPDHDACPLRPWCRTADTETRAGRDAAGAPAAKGDGPAGAASASVPSPRRRAAREARQPFRSTTRWLRGRLVDRLRDAHDGEWVRLDAPVGDHDSASVGRAIAALARDGLLERHPDDPGLVRLPAVAPPIGGAR